MNRAASKHYLHVQALLTARYIHLVGMYDRPSSSDFTLLTRARPQTVDLNAYSKFTRVGKYDCPASDYSIYGGASWNLSCVRGVASVGDFFLAYTCSFLSLLTCSKCAGGVYV